MIVTGKRFPDWDYLLASWMHEGKVTFELSFYDLWRPKAQWPKRMSQRFTTVDSLKAAIARLPAGTKVNWGKYEMSRNTSGLQYPSQDVVKDIGQFAKAHRVSLVFEFVPVE